jgi:septum formation protein
MTSKRSLPPLYLASQSPRRREILADLGIPFETIRSPYQENPADCADLSPADTASKLAALKAFHAAQNSPEGIVIGADTIVVLDNHILGKPKDREDARAMLEKLSGKPHKVITGISLVDGRGLRTLCHSEVTKVHFRALSEREIRLYAGTSEPYDKAGAYAIQGFASIFIERIEGCYYNVVGFPVTAFAGLLRQLDLDILDYMLAGRKKGD